MCVDCLYAEDELDPGRDYRLIEADMTFTAVADDCCPEFEVPAVLTWSETDPLAVEVTFQSDTHGETVWLISRESFAEGLSRPTGIGDVRFRPDLVNPRVCEIYLNSPSGELTLRFDIIEAGIFLAAVDREIQLAAAEDSAGAA